MPLETDRLLNIANRIKTPLALSGLTLLVLYAIARQILSLNVFDHLGSQPTFQLLHSLLTQLFVLAIAVLILGVGAYITLAVLNHRSGSLKSRVVLVDASLDPKDSHYAESEGGGKKVIMRGPKPLKAGTNDRDQPSR